MNARRSPRGTAGVPAPGLGAVRPGEAGYTIAELLVAAFVALIVLSVVFAAVRVQGRAAATLSGVADATITSRGSGELLTEDLRMAGYGMLGVPTAADVPPLKVDTTGGLTTLTLRGNYSNVSTTLQTAAAAGATSVIVAPPANGAAFMSGNLVLLDSGLSAEVKTITSVGSSGGNVQLGLDTPLANAYPIGPDVTQIEVVTYTYDGTLLRRNGQVLADNATTFALQYVSHDGTISATPGVNVRSVMVSIVAAQPTHLPDSPAMSSSVTTEANMRNLAFRFKLS